MNKLSKISLISSLSILGGIIAFGGVVLAQDSTKIMVENSNPETQNISTQSGEKRMQNMEQRKLNVAERIPNREQRIKDRCESVGMRIAKHQEMFTSKSQARLTKYNQITTRLETVSTKLAEKGVDVSTYNSYITELKSKITSLNTLNQDYTQLFGSKANSGEFCNNKDQLATEVETRKSKLQAVIAKDKEIRMYIKDTVLPYLKSVQPESNATNRNSTSPTNNTLVKPIQ